MYIIRNKADHKLLHIDHRPYKKSKKGRDIYPKFTKRTMEFGWTKELEIPRQFKIKKNGRIAPLNLKDKVKAGLLTLHPHQKIKGGQIIDKSTAEMVKEGQITLEPYQKLHKGEIVEKSLEEKVAEGIVDLPKEHKIVDNKIVEKTLEEQVAEGILTLDKTQKIVNNKIAEKTQGEQAREGTLDINAPFNYIAADDSIKSRTVAEIMELGLLKNQAQTEKALQRQEREVDRKVEEIYPRRQQLKTLRAYVSWLAAGKPSRDQRQKAYEEMEKGIAEIEAEGETIKKQIVQLQLKFIREK